MKLCQRFMKRPTEFKVELLYRWNAYDYTCHTRMWWADFT